MEPLAYSRELPAYVDPAEANDRLSEADESSGLGALLVVASPVALAAWLATGLAVYRLVI
jgi:uncharacterized membrane protein